MCQNWAPLLEDGFSTKARARRSTRALWRTHNSATSTWILGFEGAHRERNASGDLSRWTEGGASELKLLPAAVLPGWKCQLCCPARVTRWFLALWDEARREVGWAPVPPGASGISKHSGGPASASRAPGRVKSRPPRRGDAAPAGSPLPVSPSPPPHGARGDCPVPTGKNPVAVRTRKARWGCLDVPWPAGWLMGHPR